MNFSKRLDHQLYVQPYIYMYIHIPWPGDPHWEKMCQPRAVLKTEGTVIPDMHQLRPMNNIFFVSFSTRKQHPGHATNPPGAWTGLKNSINFQNKYFA